MKLSLAFSALLAALAIATPFVERKVRQEMQDCKKRYENCSPTKQDCCEGSYCRLVRFFLVKQHSFKLLIKILPVTNFSNVIVGIIVLKNEFRGGGKVERGMG